jgi:hypothetical protein
VPVAAPALTPALATRQAPEPGLEGGWETGRPWSRGLAAAAVLRDVALLADDVEAELAARARAQASAVRGAAAVEAARRRDAGCAAGSATESAYDDDDDEEEEDDDNDEDQMTEAPGGGGGGGGDDSDDEDDGAPLFASGRKPPLPPPKQNLQTKHGSAKGQGSKGHAAQSTDSGKMLHLPVKPKNRKQHLHFPRPQKQDQQHKKQSKGKKQPSWLRRHAATSDDDDDDDEEEEATATETVTDASTGRRCSSRRRRTAAAAGDGASGDDDEDEDEDGDDAAADAEYRDILASTARASASAGAAATADAVEDAAYILEDRLVRDPISGRLVRVKVPVSVTAVPAAAPASGHAVPGPSPLPPALPSGPAPVLLSVPTLDARAALRHRARLSAAVDALACALLPAVALPPAAATEGISGVALGPRALLLLAAGESPTDPVGVLARGPLTADPTPARSGPGRRAASTAARAATAAAATSAAATAVKVRDAPPQRSAFKPLAGTTPFLRPSGSGSYAGSGAGAGASAGAGPVAVSGSGPGASSSLPSPPLLSPRGLSSDSSSLAAAWSLRPALSGVSPSPLPFPGAASAVSNVFAQTSPPAAPFALAAVAAAPVSPVSPLDADVDDGAQQPLDATLPQSLSQSLRTPSDPTLGLAPVPLRMLALPEPTVALGAATAAGYSVTAGTRARAGTIAGASTAVSQTEASTPTPTLARGPAPTQTRTPTLTPTPTRLEAATARVRAWKQDMRSSLGAGINGISGRLPRPDSACSLPDAAARTVIAPALTTGTATPASSSSLSHLSLLLPAPTPAAAAAAVAAATPPARAHAHAQAQSRAAARARTLPRVGTLAGRQGPGSGAADGVEAEGMGLARVVVPRALAAPPAGAGGSSVSVAGGTGATALGSLFDPPNLAAAAATIRPCVIGSGPGAGSGGAGVGVGLSASDAAATAGISGGRGGSVVSGQGTPGSGRSMRAAAAAAAGLPPPLSLSNSGGAGGGGGGHRVHRQPISGHGREPRQSPALSRRGSPLVAPHRLQGVQPPSQAQSPLVLPRTQSPQLLAQRSRSQPDSEAGSDAGAGEGGVPPAPLPPPSAASPGPGPAAGVGLGSAPALLVSLRDAVLSLQLRGALVFATTATAVSCYSAASGRRLHRLPPPPRQTLTAADADAGLVVYGTADSVVRVHSLLTGAQTSAASKLGRHLGAITGIALLGSSASAAVGAAAAAAADAGASPAGAGGIQASMGKRGTGASAIAGTGSASRRRGAPPTGRGKGLFVARGSARGSDDDDGDPNDPFSPGAASSLLSGGSGAGAGGSGGSAGGVQFATTALDGCLHVWNAETGACVSKFSLLGGRRPDAAELRSARAASAAAAAAAGAGGDGGAALGVTHPDFRDCCRDAEAQTASPALDSARVRNRHAPLGARSAAARRRLAAALGDPLTTGASTCLVPLSSSVMLTGSLLPQSGHRRVRGAVTVWDARAPGGGVAALVVAAEGSYVTSLGVADGAPLCVAGGSDGVAHVWDVRYLARSDAISVAPTAGRSAGTAVDALPGLGLGDAGPSAAAAGLYGDLSSLDAPYARDGVPTSVLWSDPFSAPARPAPAAARPLEALAAAVATPQPWTLSGLGRWDCAATSACSGAGWGWGSAARASYRYLLDGYAAPASAQRGWPATDTGAGAERWDPLAPQQLGGGAALQPQSLLSLLGEIMAPTPGTAAMTGTAAKAAVSASVAAAAAASDSRLPPPGSARWFGAGFGGPAGSDAGGAMPLHARARGCWRAANEPYPRAGAAVSSARASAPRDADIISAVVALPNALITVQPSRVSFIATQGVPRSEPPTAAPASRDASASASASGPAVPASALAYAHVLRQWSPVALAHAIALSGAGAGAGADSIGYGAGDASAAAALAAAASVAGGGGGGALPWEHAAAVVRAARSLDVGGARDRGWDPAFTLTAAAAANAAAGGAPGVATVPTLGGTASGFVYPRSPIGTENDAATASGRSRRVRSHGSNGDSDDEDDGAIPAAGGALGAAAGGGHRDGAVGAGAAPEAAADDDVDYGDDEPWPWEETGPAVAGRAGGRGGAGNVFAHFHAASYDPQSQSFALSFGETVCVWAQKTFW